ncbi:hypothetical protein E2C01_073623 [Portunus trituberculatus]|uniref:Uncharacterized protein n=1 Tax=Portunus trituberculatus TaxID=210409 RepID=A0A5B7I3H8_PORTR|nr:hypothetical protein [Portunus trituberculatus]
MAICSPRMFCLEQVLPFKHMIHVKGSYVLCIPGSPPLIRSRCTGEALGGNTITHLPPTWLI